MSSALVMFGFMYWLTRSGLVAFFAAYAVTYTPFHAFASHGHIAGLQGAIFMLALLAFEIRSFPTSTFSPSHFNYQDTPAVYRWLQNNQKVRSVAEYPLDEPPQGHYLAHYYTFQQVSRKPLLNTFVPNSSEMPLRRSIAGINDPQTLPVLRALGVDLVNMRPAKLVGNAPDLRLAASLNGELKRIFSDKRAAYKLD